MGTAYDPSLYPQVLQDFAGYKSVIQGCSPLTINEYMLDLRSFFTYLLSRRKKIKYGTPEYENITLGEIDLDFLASVTTSDIYDYLFFAQRELGNAPAARARKLSAIKGLYRYYTAKRGVLDRDPSINIETPKKQKTLPKYLTYDEAVLLLDTVRNDTSARPASARLRNYAMITLFLNCGMRLSELVGINIGDIDKYLRSLRVLGKGNKERIIYLNDACKSVLSEYLPERTSPNYTSSSTRALFLSSRGTRISNRSVQWTVEKYLEMAGLGYRRFSVHKLRHTAATLMYQKGGVDVRVLKDILGHEQLNTTQIYTHVANDDMERAMSKNPLAAFGTADSAPAADTRPSYSGFESLTGEGADVGRDDTEPFSDEDNADDAEDYGSIGNIDDHN